MTGAVKKARALLPVLLALGLTAWVLSRVDWTAFGHALAQVRYGAFGAFVLAFVLSLLAADTFATVGIYRRWAPSLGHRELFVLRGASYLPSLVNHHIGQAWLTFMLARRHGIDLARMAGATLLVYASWGGAILALASVSLLAADMPLAWLALPLGLGLGYLALLAIAPRGLARRRVFAALFEAGIAGHLRAMLLRVPHLGVLFLGTWLPYAFFGVDVPLGTALVYVPIIMVAVTLPLTPQGLGTRDALAVAFFTPFAVGTSDEERRAAVAACTTATAAMLIVIEVVLALVLMRLDRRSARGSARGSESPSRQ